MTEPLNKEVLPPVERSEIEYMTSEQLHANNERSLRAVTRWLVVVAGVVSLGEIIRIIWSV